MGPRINKIFGMSRVTSKGSAPELVKRETDTRVTCMVDALKHSETLCAMSCMIRHKFIALDTPTRELLKEKNRTLEDMVNAMFLSLGLSHGMWGKVIISATSLLDKIHCKENKIVLMNYRWEEDYLKIDDEVVQDQRQRDDNDLQDERQDQPKEEEVEPRRSKRARIKKLFGPDFVSFMVENEPTSYQEAVTFSEWLNGKKPFKVK
ncbi:hypothetical protein Tco_0730511 [Tanacetum coccineum]|uniref:Uncharacterized protein n=1 Tax=Tanacetum coccineum TaxID=301880 RepID=A0ABQ4YSZ3_9ASTR